jgi:phage tail sheath protein FI
MTTTELDSQTLGPKIRPLPTGTAVFLGPTLTGPELSSAPELLSSFADFERTYGGLDDLHTTGSPRPNYVAHAARVFFENGGTRLHIIRTPSNDCDAQTTVQDYAAALEALQYLEFTYLLAAPGASALADDAQIRASLVAHVEANGCRAFAILDAPPQSTAGQLQRLREQIDSPHAALYHPWIVIGDSTKGRRGPQLAELHMPPSAFVCGLLSRDDREYGLATIGTAHELIGALGVEQPESQSEMERLLSLGVNCVRWSVIDGSRIWAATTLSSDPTWKYVNVRRYVSHFEHSIQNGLQWIAGTHEGHGLHDAARKCVLEFLYAQWQLGAFRGATPEEAFFVRDQAARLSARRVTSQPIQLTVGLAILKPAEFLVFDIAVNGGQAN